MAPLTIPDDVRAKAEIYVGDAAGQEKTRLLLQETGLPSGLLPLRDIVECGYVEETGFVWLKQRRKVDHYFAGAGRHVSYGAEVSAVAEKGRLKKITGVKAKEMLIWVSLHEICLDDYNNPSAAAAAAAGGNKKLVCKALGGLSRSFPAEAFEAVAPAPVNNKPTPVAATTNRDAVVVVSGNGAATAAVANKGQEEAKKQEEVEKQLEEEEEAKREEDGKAKKEVEKDGKQAKEDAIDAVEEKLKDMTTTTEAVHAEAVAAKN